MEEDSRPEWGKGGRRRQACWGAKAGRTPVQGDSRAGREFWGPETCPFLGPGTGEADPAYVAAVQNTVRLTISFEGIK